MIPASTRVWIAMGHTDIRKGMQGATQRADEAEAKLANAHARESATEAVIAHLKLQTPSSGASSTAPAPSAPAAC